MSVLVLDSEALWRLAHHRAGRTDATQAAVTAALAHDVDVVVPAAVLAELYRGARYDQAVDACLGRYGDIVVVSTTRTLARRIGHLLARAGRSSADHVDATVVAVAVAAGGGVIATGDPDDIKAIAGDEPGVGVEQV